MPVMKWLGIIKWGFQVKMRKFNFKNLFGNTITLVELK